MGIKDSKRMQILREKGLCALMQYFLHTSYGRWRKHINKTCIMPLLTLYPKFALNKNQYEVFQTAKKHFRENYANIIAINPLFFMQNLKKHIAWIESKEFQENYGNIFTLHATEKQKVATEKSHIDSKNAQYTSKNKSVIESKKADSINNATNPQNNAIITPPPPLYPLCLLLAIILPIKNMPHKILAA